MELPNAQSPRLSKISPSLTVSVSLALATAFVDGRVGDIVDIGGYSCSIKGENYRVTSISPNRMRVTVNYVKNTESITGNDCSMLSLPRIYLNVPGQLLAAGFYYGGTITSRSHFSFFV